MQLLRPTLASLAIFTIVLSFTAFESVTGEKPLTCCTKVSTKKIEDEIIGFKFQRQNLPCVKAVVFETTKGKFCSHWQEKWVQETIRTIRRKQNLERAMSTDASATAVPSISSSPAATEYLSSAVVTSSSSS